MEVHFQRHDQVGSYQILTPETTPVRTGDRIQIHGRFAQPVYAYLVAVTPDGDWGLIRTDDGDRIEPSRDFVFPADPNRWIPLGPAPMTETMLLFATPDPAQTGANLVAQLQALGPAPRIEGASLVFIDGPAVTAVPAASERIDTAASEAIEASALARLDELTPDPWPIVVGITFHHEIDHE